MNKWPELKYGDWKETYLTLHRMTQVIGKVRMSLSPWTNHSWSTTLYVNARGLTTSAISLKEKIITIDLDFLSHEVIILSSDGHKKSLPLLNQSVATFYQQLLSALKELKIEPNFDPHPNECDDYIPFAKDDVHCHYDPEQVTNFFNVLLRVHHVMNQFRSEFTGKVSPIHFFWGAFDLAVTRFSGREAPEHPGIAPHVSKLVMKEGYSHELSSCGFWPGNEQFPEPAFYSYAYPAPAKFSEANIIPKEAFYAPDLGEYFLRYQDVIKASDPGQMVLDFFRSTFEAASKFGLWDEKLYRPSSFLQQMQSLHSPH